MPFALPPVSVSFRGSVGAKGVNLAAKGRRAVIPAASDIDIQIGNSTYGIRGTKITDIKNHQYEYSGNALLVATSQPDRYISINML